MREDWVEVELGEVLTVSSGTGLTSNKMSGSGYPVYGGNGITGYHSNYLFEEEKLIIGRVGVRCGVTHITKPKSWVTDNALVVSFKFPILNLKFLQLKLQFENLNKLSNSTAQPVISGAKIYSYSIKIPPLPIQRAIVRKIETLFASLDKGIADLKTAQEQLKVYRQAVLKKAFEGGFTNKNVIDGELHEGWKWVKLWELAKYISDGDHQAPPKANQGVPFITISNIDKVSNTIDFSDSFFVNIDYYNSLKENRKPQKGDVLYTVTGSFGIPVMIDFDKQFCFQRHIGLIRPIDNVVQKWLFYLLQTKLVYNQAEEKATGTAQKTVALSTLRNIRIPFCSLTEQHAIVREIESRLSVCDKVEQSIAEALEKAEALRQSILKKAFEGKLLSAAEIARCKQEADYEPASTLLARIERSRNERIRKEKKNGK